jgi:hypothetical protein
LEGNPEGRSGEEFSYSVGSPEDESESRSKGDAEWISMGIPKIQAANGSSNEIYRQGSPNPGEQITCVLFVVHLVIGK